VQTAKGDINGVIFDHTQAVGPLVADRVSMDRHFLPDGLHNIVTEHYFHTAIISMIWIDQSVSTGRILAPELEYEAQALVESGYVGYLCGLKFSLFFIIPRIFGFGRRRKLVGVEPPFPSADDFLDFYNL
jgi:hypothetical protein